MKKNQIFALLFTGVLIVLLLVASCNSKEKQPSEEQPAATEQTENANGNAQPSQTTSTGEESVEKALELIEKGSNPMEGIQMLRNIAEKEPENTQAQFYLGIFSLQTGQFEKAKERFETVLKLEPKSIEAHLYYSDALAQLGETEKSIKELETASELTDNEELKKQINARIEQLKNM
ncbi:MAG: hypothetical protein D6707_00725 [Bacteroidetes bacterium]|nr:MAG: hypothetical protein D6707_00725 [Bacteroidota bacterium]